MDTEGIGLYMIKAVTLQNMALASIPARLNQKEHGQRHMNIFTNRFFPTVQMASQTSL